ncbi:hypothetical protein FGO68_gene5377 [Halteria grandinella]|uniref:Uncharacterized protein n=1 Tax=Halteria grandinella TaxID=5974 RepID=A0A8J8NZ60_HALGN|nr:hypothetical protein FGO68_gene5377 [Halteria grandinella]
MAITMIQWENSIFQITITLCIMKNRSQANNSLISAMNLEMIGKSCPKPQNNVKALASSAITMIKIIQETILSLKTLRKIRYSNKLLERSPLQEKMLRPKIRYTHKKTITLKKAILYSRGRFFRNKARLRVTKINTQPMRQVLILRQTMNNLLLSKLRIKVSQLIINLSIF